MIDANAVAQRCHDELFEAHRGAIRWGTDGSLTVIFGNDGYSGKDGRAVREVERLRRWLDENECEELAFGLSDDGYTWAMVIDDDGANDREKLTDLMFAIWAEVCSGGQPTPTSGIMPIYLQALAAKQVLACHYLFN